MPKDYPTIMVVEDEVLLLQAITKKLKLSNMDVLSCSSGQQAVDYLESLDALPDGIWLDMYLPDMNGLDFMQRLKSNPKWAQIPVIVVSNSASAEKVHNMLALGAKRYILKAEYRLDEIITMIREFLASEVAEKDKDDEGTQDTAAPAPAGPAVPPQAAVPPVQVPPPSTQTPPAAAPQAPVPPAPPQQPTGGTQ